MSDKSKDAFWGFADALRQVIWGAAADGVVDYANPYWFEISGLAEDSLENGWASALHPDDRERVAASWYRAHTYGEDYRHETRFRLKDGDYHWFLLEGNKVYDEAGKIVRWVGYATDIEAQKRSQLLARQALSAGNFGAWELDITKGECHYDSFTQEAFDIPAQIPLSEGLERVHPEDRENISKIIEAALEPQGTGRYEVEHRFLVKGKYRWTAAEGVATFVGEGEKRRATLLSGVLRDIHERKTTELKLQDLTERLEERVEIRTRQVRALAAELTRAEQKEREALAVRLHDSVQQELLAVQFALAGISNLNAAQKAAIEHADGLLRDTFQLTRDITSDLRPSVLDEKDFCVSLKWLAASMERKFGLDVTVLGLETCEVDDAAIRTLLYTLTRELLFNVVKHADTQKATVRVDLDDEILVVSVEDKGKGFDPDTLTNTGLGLSGAAKRLELFGGELSVKSVLEQGSRITLRLSRRGIDENLNTH